MSDPRSTVPEPPPAGGERRRLDRAPGERYTASGTSATGSSASGRSSAGSPGGGSDGGGRRRTVRAVVAATLVAALGTALFFLVGLLDVGAGLLGVAAFTGWIIAVALVWWGRDAIAVRRTRVATAVFLSGGAIVAAIILDWGYALAQGGVLGLPDYIAQRYGAVGPLAVVLAAAVAAIRVR